MKVKKSANVNILQDIDVEALEERRLMAIHTLASMGLSLAKALEVPTMQVTLTGCTLGSVRVDNGKAL